MSPCSRLGVLPQPLQPLPASSFLEDLAWTLHLCPPAQIPSGEQGTVTGSHVTAEEAGSVPGLPLLPSNKTILEAGDGLWWVGGYLPAPGAPLEEPARGLAGRQGCRQLLSGVSCVLGAVLLARWTWSCSIIAAVLGR